MSASRPAIDDDGRVRRRVRPRQAVSVGHRVVAPGERDLLLRPERLHDRQPLDHARHPHTRLVVGEARLVVVGLHPPRAEAELDPALSGQVQGGDLLGQHDRMAVVVVEDERSDPQGRRRLRRHRQGHQGPELVAEVVWDVQARIAERLAASGKVAPRPHRRGHGALDGKAKGTRHGRIVGWRPRSPQSSGRPGRSPQPASP